MTKIYKYFQLYGRNTLYCIFLILSLSITGCFSRETNNIDPTKIATAEAKILCNTYNELYGEQEIVFALKTRRSDNEMVRMLCVRKKGLIIPGSGEPIPRPVPLPEIMQKIAIKIDKDKLRKKKHHHEDNSKKPLEH